MLVSCAETRLVSWVHPLPMVYSVTSAPSSGGALIFVSGRSRCADEHDCCDRGSVSLQPEVEAKDFH